jgi:hypothetical protein
MRRYPHRAFCRAIRSTSARTSAETGGRPAAFGYVHFLLTSHDQPPVPIQQRGRGHDAIQPQATGQQPRHGGEHGTVSPVQPRAADLTMQHRDLMPQNQDLRVLGSVAARQEHQPSEQPDHEQVDKTDQHERRA